MRRSFFLYLFVFALVVIVIQYSNASKMMGSKNERIEYLEEELDRISRQEDSLASLNASLNYFSLESNEGAMNYLEENGYDVQEVVQMVEYEVISGNKASEDHELVPFEGMDGNMRINKIKILNHRWILADFTDGSYWGELFITYFLDENGQLELRTDKSVLYPGN